jgi:hypothetical protein
MAKCKFLVLICTALLKINFKKLLNCFTKVYFTFSYHWKVNSKTIFKKKNSNTVIECGCEEAFHKAPHRVTGIEKSSMAHSHFPISLENYTHN